MLLRNLVSCGLLVGSCLICNPIAAEDSGPDFAAIGQLNEAYATAFNQQDAKAIASLFTADGDYSILTGDLLMGRPQIAAGHAAFFKNNPGAKIDGKQLTRRHLRDDVVVATGRWKVENGPSDYPSSGAWSTVVVKDDGKWKYGVMRITAVATPSR